MTLASTALTESSPGPPRVMALLLAVKESQLPPNPVLKAHDEKCEQ